MSTMHTSVITPLSPPAEAAQVGERIHRLVLKKGQLESELRATERELFDARVELDVTLALIALGRRAA